METSSTGLRMCPEIYDSLFKVEKKTSPEQNLHELLRSTVTKHETQLIEVDWNLADLYNVLK